MTFKYLAQFLFLLLLPVSSWACPYCLGTDDSAKATSIIIVLAIFIAAIYIPYVLIFRMIIKYRKSQLPASHEHPSTSHS